MSDPYALVADCLSRAGFHESEPGCFTSAVSPRVIALTTSSPDFATWQMKVEQLLRKASMRRTLSWARYALIVVQGKKTAELAWAAAAFAHDVSKCRRVILFVDPTVLDPVTVPFLELSFSSPSADTPPRDPEPVVRAILPPDLAEAFLDESLPLTRVQELAQDENG